MIFFPKKSLFLYRDHNAISAYGMSRAFVFVHRFFAASRAICDRRSGIILEKPFGTLRLPPSRPKETAAGFFLVMTAF
jgi:hypothetical protein